MLCLCSSPLREEVIPAVYPDAPLPMPQTLKERATATDLKNWLTTLLFRSKENASSKTALHTTLEQKTFKLTLEILKPQFSKAWDGDQTIDIGMVSLGSTGLWGLQAVAIRCVGICNGRAQFMPTRATHFPYRRM